MKEPFGQLVKSHIARQVRAAGHWEGKRRGVPCEISLECSAEDPARRVIAQVRLSKTKTVSDRFGTPTEAVEWCNETVLQAPMLRRQAC